ncbi:uncharacterized protein LOC131218722 [Magnolia sinica]|uniref:uncharacterized protein LOC131218722 n=1 Tax=Magnolia sinica TaxID=86752 RepID=UPI00265A110C|nr:uncharacterized protein LOC131218722 [Magnolia sinica]
MEGKMEGEGSIRTPPSPSNGQQQLSLMSQLKKECLSLAASLQEGLRYIKAIIVGQVMKLKARDEEEAAEADLQTAKMQVEATDEAEHTKKQLDM